MSAVDSLLDDLFSWCAFTAFVEQAHIDRGWPDPEATRIRAYKLYEDELAARASASTASVRLAGRNLEDVQQRQGP